MLGVSKQAVNKVIKQLRTLGLRMGNSPEHHGGSRAACLWHRATKQESQEKEERRRTA